MNNDLVSLRINAEELKFLLKISSENNLVKKDGSPSLGLAVKQLIKQNLSSTKNENDKDLQTKIDHLTTLVEQINISIPHIMYNTTFTYKISESPLNSDTFSQFKDYVLKEISATCGQIQNQKYENIYISTDKKNMKTMPIDSEKAQWK